ncbi:MAG: MFS transporter [Gammaproteobacteria bacterium]|nr:MFS transporter [Gammaproteobacteria bacterium]
MNRRSWYVVGVLTVAYICSFIDRSVLGLMVGPIRSELGISDTQFSLLHGFAFAIFYTLLGIPIAWLADRASRRNIIAAGIAVWSLMTAFCGLARTFGAMFMARVGVGVGEAALSPAAYSMIADLFPREKLGRALGIYSSGVFIGIGLSFILVAELIGALDTVNLPVVGELTPWRLTLIVLGIPGLAIAALCFTFREPARLGAAKGGVPLGEVGRFFGSNFSLYALHFVAFSMLTLLFNAVMAWFAEYLIRIHDMDRGDAGWYIGLIVTFFGGGGIICGGLYADYLKRRGDNGGAIRSALLAAVVLLPFGAAATLMPNAGLSLLLCAPLLFFSSWVFAPATTALQLFTPPAMRAQFSAVYLFVVNLTGIGFGGTAVALITDFVFRDDDMLHYSIALTAGLSGLVSIILLWRLLAIYRRGMDAREQELATESVP